MQRRKEKKGGVKDVLLNWAIGREVNAEERQSLSAAMLEACPDRPIHWLYLLEDTADVRPETPMTLSKQLYIAYTNQHKYKIEMLILSW